MQQGTAPKLGIGGVHDSTVDFGDVGSRSPAAVATGSPAGPQSPLAGGVIRPQWVDGLFAPNLFNQVGGGVFRPNLANPNNDTQAPPEDNSSFKPIPGVQVVLPGKPAVPIDFLTLFNGALTQLKDPTQPPGPDNPTNQEQFIAQVKDNIARKLSDNGLSLAGGINVDLGPVDQRKLEARVIDNQHVQIKLVLRGASVELPVRKPAAQTAIESIAAGIFGVLFPPSLALTLPNVADQEVDFRTSFDVELTTTIELPGVLHPGTLPVRGKDDQPWDNLQVTKFTQEAVNFNLHPENFGADEAQFIDTIRQVFGARSWFDPGGPMDQSTQQAQSALKLINQILAAAYQRPTNQLLNVGRDKASGAVQFVVSPSPDQTIDYGDGP
jgi:hypothetical protein